MRAILHADKNWGIGKNNGLMFKIPADMKFFKETDYKNFFRRKFFNFSKKLVKRTDNFTIISVLAVGVKHNIKPVF